MLVTEAVTNPCPGSDEIFRACEDAWVGVNGYLRSDGSRQLRSIAFQGQVVTAAGQSIVEAFVVDLPESVMEPGELPLEGTPSTLPAPPRGTKQRRLTHTQDRKFPGLQGPRHWLRSSPDGSQIAMLMRNDSGVVQLWSISPNGGEPRQLTNHAFDIASAFSWSPDGRSIACIADQSVFITDVASGISTRLTNRTGIEYSPRPEACVFSPDGRQIAYVRPVCQSGETWNQIYVVACDQ